MAEPGAVAWQFERKGVILVPVVGATRTTSCWSRSTPAPRTSPTTGDTWQRHVRGRPLTDAVRQALEEAGIAVESADLTMLPTSTVALDAADDGQGGAAADRRARRPRRRPGRLRQLRHPRRRPRRRRGLTPGAEHAARRCHCAGLRAPGRRRHGPATSGSGRWASSRAGRWSCVFYPGDGSPVCTRQLTEYTEDIGRLRRRRRPGAGPVAPVSRVAPGASPNATAGSASRCWPTRTRRWPGTTACSGLLDFYRRSTFVVDAEGIVALRPPLRRPGLGFRPVEELVGAVAALAPPRTDE